ncbi:MAG: ribosomal L7Ae/L30e/S12e/Gadd45 family protein [Gemmatimonadetes bacterium]|nr:ribosomal L7Ae/L30e/S12e/Gadd45 family protein [Gemmatimonadota bacterium]
MLRAKNLKTEKIGRLLGLGARARSLSLGSRETRAAMRRGQVHLILLARGGSPRDQERLERLAEEEGVPLGLLTVDADGLGEWVGRNRVAVIGMTDRNLADAIRAELTRQDSADTGHGPEDGPSKRGGSKT